jgi:hypothetical protein
MLSHHHFRLIGQGPLILAISFPEAKSAANESMKSLSLFLFGTALGGLFTAVNPAFIEPRPGKIIRTLGPGISHWLMVSKLGRQLKTKNRPLGHNKENKQRQE